MSHHQKYISKLLLGIALITTGIFVVVYLFANTSLHEDWLLWGLGIAIMINAGLILLGNAFIHKMKSDLIRKQKQREHLKTFIKE